MFAQKKIIYALNKADLGSVSLVDVWVRYLTDSKNAAVVLDSTASKSANLIPPLAKKMCAEKLDRFMARGIKTSVRALVAGVPNCGKSTLINNLANKAKTVTGNKPGVTKGMQWVKVTEYFEVLDSPGTLYPKLIDENTARRLAYIGSIKDEVFDKTELSLFLIEDLLKVNPQILSERFKIVSTGKAHEDLENMALSRGYILKGGAPDTDRMAAAFIDDFRKGRLGRITLDMPPDKN
ncbi:mitochondrial ribosome-associated gtpase 1 [Holotrichia oblita]|nr:mitochondrial ribosome-associated gtpase 1 [Holotrichia oblita]